MRRLQSYVPALTMPCLLFLAGCGQEQQTPAKKVDAQSTSVESTAPANRATPEEHAEEGRSSRSSGSRSMPIKIAYDYKGEFGIYGIADTASAYAGDTLVGKARLLRLIDTTSGPKDFEVEEEHYSDTGDVVYKGKIIFKYNMGDWAVGQREPIRGTPRFSVFRSWPAGR